MCNKIDLKNVTHVDTSSFALKIDLASLETEVDKLDIGKIVPVPVDLSKLSDVVKMILLKKTVCDTLVAKVNNIDTSDFVLKTNSQTPKTKLGKKIPDAIDTVRKIDTKIAEIEDKIHDTSNLATKTALTTVGNIIPSVSSLVKKTDYDTTITEIENKLDNHNYGKFITTPEFNTLAKDVFNVRLS